MEEEVQEFCPKARIARLDGTAEDQEETIRAFAKGEFDILLGNTMTTRGFESEKLGLVALVAADSILSRQDFRADERSLQVLEQFRGRCRRLVIQTREPGHPVFSALQDGGDATARMLEERRVAGYPPFTRMIRISVKDSNEKRLEFLSRELAGELGSLGVPLEGPYPSSIGPMREDACREIRLLLPRDKALTARKSAIGQTVTAFEQARKYPGHIAIDVDPA
jgi:primosomal protein N' (replication factor Y)